jgi:hypothetical protein
MPQNSINLSEVLSLIVHSASEKCALFSHIDSAKCLICVSSSRSGRGGIYGKLVPLRFENGERVLIYKNRKYIIPSLFIKETEILYIVYFYMPKFFNLPAKDKLNVIFHELYHISPLFNGDIRRMGKVKAAHGHSKKHYDSNYENELNEFFSYLEQTPFINFLKLDEKGLKKNFKKIKSVRMKLPKPFIA